MKSQVNYFRELHQQENPLLIGNAWNAQSAKVFEKQQFKAIATSSAAVAETLGYKDGEEMTFEEYLFIIKRIKASSTLPLSVDMEAGYGETAKQIVNNIKQLSEAGVAGINIEDSKVANGKRSIEDTGAFVLKLEQITRLLKEQNIPMFINVRCDAFLLGLPDARNEALKRLSVYQNTGIDGIFLPCITDIEDIKAITAACKLPLNVMCMPTLPGFDELNAAGVKRISIGNFLNSSIYTKLDQQVAQIVSDQNFSVLF